MNEERDSDMTTHCGLVSELHCLLDHGHEGPHRTPYSALSEENERLRERVKNLEAALLRKRGMDNLSDEAWIERVLSMVDPNPAPTEG